MKAPDAKALKKQRESIATVMSCIIRSQGVDVTVPLADINNVLCAAENYIYVVEKVTEKSMNQFFDSIPNP